MSGDENAGSCWVTFSEKGNYRDSKAGSASNSGNLSMVLPLSPPPGDRLSSFRVKGAKQGVEC